jgi:hypothetical protein
MTIHAWKPLIVFRAENLIHPFRPTTWHHILLARVWTKSFLLREPRDWTKAFVCKF